MANPSSGYSKIPMVLRMFLVRLCLWLLTHTFYRIRVRGIKNLPARGPALLVCNHISFVDPFLIGACTKRIIRFLMYRRFYETAGIHWLARLMGAIPVSPTDEPRRMEESFREARQRLREGELVCIFAEGAMIRAGALLPFRQAFEHITRGLSVPIIPLHLDRVWGDILSFERGRFCFKWPRQIPYPVTASFGAPLPPDSAACHARQALINLGAEASVHRDTVQRPLPALFLDCARRNWRRFAMADTLGFEFNFGRTLVGAMLFRRFILERCAAEKMIGILLPPTVSTALLNIGTSLAGKIPVNLNYTSSAESLDFALQRCGIKTLFTSERLLERKPELRRAGMVMIDQAAREFSWPTKAIYLFAARLMPRFLLRRWLLPRDIKLDSLATVIFSSGSTGTPKGVMLSHRNIVSNIESISQVMNVDRNDCILGVLPIFHSFGFTVGLWLPAIQGFGAAYHINPLDGRKIGELCRKYHVTLIVSTPSFVWEYVRRCATEEFASLRVAIVGAERMDPELGEAFKQKFGLDLFQGYGCTELSPVVSVETSGYVSADANQARASRGSVGRPIPGVAVQVVDLETSQPLPAGRDGMLLVKGANVMMGYFGDAGKTRQVIRPGGWYVTGDVARVDEEGFISITGRLSRFSKIAGEMVDHVRVEIALQRALGSVEPKLVVTSLADEKKGEKLVVLHTQLDIPVDELLNRVRQAGLPALWVPRKDAFFQIESLPVLGAGKLDLYWMKEAAKRLEASVRAKSVGKTP